MLHPQTACLAEGVGHVPPRIVESVFPGDMTSPRAARCMVREHLGDGVADDCALMVSELVTNAVVHGGSSTVRLRLAIHPGWIYVEVADDGCGMPQVTDGDPEAVNGRGLIIIDSLAREWGVLPQPGGGKIVWFILRSA